VQDREPRRTRDLARRIEPRAVEDDVVCLPLAGRATGVHQRWKLSVDRRRLAVGIRLVLVRVQHLHLVPPHEEDTTVTALLTLAHRGQWRHPLHVQLRVPECVARDDPSSAGHHLHISLLDLPAGRAASLLLPSRKVGADQHRRIRGRGDRPAVRRRIDDARLRAVRRVNRPSRGWLRVGVMHDDCDERRTANANAGDAPNEGGGVGAHRNVGARG